MSDLLKDLRLGARLLLKNPGYSLVVTLTLALAIGANTIVFGFTDLLLLRPLPFGDPNRVVFMYSANAQRNVDRSKTSLPDFLDCRAQSSSYEEMAGFEPGAATMTGRGEPLRVSVMRATANLFTVWDTHPLIGRTFIAGEDALGRSKVAILSHRFWMGHFNGSSEVIDHPLTLNGEPYTIVGVLTEEMEVGNFETIDLWTPLPLDATGSRRDDRSVRITATLKSGMTLDKANIEARGISQRLEQAYPTTNAGWSFRVLKECDAIVGPDTWQILALLTIVVGFVLVVACANIANMMLARATARQREIAVRLALGATRFRLVRQTVTESLLLGLAGGLAGLAVTRGGIRAIQAISSDYFLRQLRVSWHALAFVLGLATIAPLLFSVLPALQASRTDANEGLKSSGTRLSGGPAGRRVRSTLVVAQLALALALLVVATLVTRTIASMELEPRGVQTTNVLTAQVQLERPKYTDLALVTRFAERATERLGALPGVHVATATTVLPLVGGEPTQRFYLVNRPRPQVKDTPWATVVAITPDYVRVFDLKLSQGRSFTRYDASNAPGVALVSREAARRYWPNESPIGQHIQYEQIPGKTDETRDRTPGAPSTAASSTVSTMEIVGVVDDVKTQDVTDPAPPRIYRPLAQGPDRAIAFALRTEGDPNALGPSVRAALRDIDPDVALSEMRALDQTLRLQFAENYVLVGLFASFALLALVLAGTGLYGVTAYAVSQRTQEIGIRMALGASGSRVLTLVLSQNALLVAIGAFIGIAGGVALGRAMRSILYRVGPNDPATLITMLGIMTAVSFVATYVPARRASHIDPLVALHQD